MPPLIYKAGCLAAVSGLGLCGLSGLLRIAGFYSLPLMDTGTLFLLGVGLMVAGSLALQLKILQLLAKTP